MSRNVFRETLVQEGITSGIQLAERMDCPAVIFFFAGPKVEIPYAELRYWDDKGEEHTFKALPRYLNMSLPAMRRKTVQEAQDKALEVLGLVGWAKSPFDNCWMPASVLQAAREQYMQVSQRA